MLQAALSPGATEEAWRQANPISSRVRGKPTANGIKEAAERTSPRESMVPNHCDHISQHVVFGTKSKPCECAKPDAACRAVACHRSSLACAPAGTCLESLREDLLPTDLPTKLILMEALSEKQAMEALRACCLQESHPLHTDLQLLNWLLATSELLCFIPDCLQRLHKALRHPDAFTI